MSEPQDYPKVRVRYEGPIGSHTVVGLATRQKYGRHARGAILWVHRDDVVANPEYFTVLGADEGASVADRLPKAPDQVRQPEPPAPVATWNGVAEAALAQKVEELGPTLDEQAAPPSPAEITGWLQEAAPSEGLAGLPSELVEPPASSEPQPGGEELPAELATLDQIGISEKLAGSLARVGLVAVSDVVAYVKLSGEEGLAEIDGVSTKAARVVVAKLREHGYLEDEA